VADVSHFIKVNSLVDREARKRGSAVYLTNRVVPMLPARLSNDVCSLLPGKDRLTISVVFLVDRKSGAVEGEPWIGKGIIRSSGKLTYDDIEAVIAGKKDVELQGTTVEDIKTLNVSCEPHSSPLLVLYGN
jgi:protein SSD1